MNLRFYEDPATGQPHIYNHGVTEREVEELFESRGIDLPAAKGARQRLGSTAAGRYLKVIYVPDDDPESVFVITAYELKEKAKKALRKRLRNKRK